MRVSPVNTFSSILILVAIYATSGHDVSYTIIEKNDAGIDVNVHSDVREVNGTSGQSSSTSEDEITDVMMRTLEILKENHHSQVLLKRPRRVAPLVPIVVGAVVRGAIALKRANTMRKVLKGTKPGKNKPSKSTEEHISKTKDPMADADKRFDSVKPKNVEKIETKNGITGRQGDVGDLRITVRDKKVVKEQGTGKRTLVDRPTVEVFKKDVPKKDRITTKIRHDKAPETPKSTSGSGEKSGGGWWGGGKKSNTGSSKKSSTGSSNKSSGSGSSGGGKSGGGWWRRK